MNLLNDELSGDYPYHDVTAIGAKAKHAVGVHCTMIDDIL
jgi:hypothetical protein